MALDIVAWHDRTLTDHLTQLNNARTAGYSTISLCIYGDRTDPRYAVTMVKRATQTIEHHFPEQKCSAQLQRPSAVFAIKKVANCCSSGCIHLTFGLTFVGILATLAGRIVCFGYTASRASVCKTRLVRPQLKFLRTDNTHFDRKRHLSSSMLSNTTRFR